MSHKCNSMPLLTVSVEHLSDCIWCIQRWCGSFNYNCWRKTIKRQNSSGLFLQVLQQRWVWIQHVFWRPLLLHTPDVTSSQCYSIISATAYDRSTVRLWWRKIRAKQKWHQTEGSSLVDGAEGKRGCLAQYGGADGKAAQRQPWALCQRKHVLDTYTGVRVNSHTYPQARTRAHTHTHRRETGTRTHSHSSKDGKDSWKKSNKHAHTHMAEAIIMPS